MATCECGCGQETRMYRGRPRRFLKGHNENNANYKPGLEAAAKVHKARYYQRVARHLQVSVERMARNGSITVADALRLLLKERQRAYRLGWTAHYQRTRRQGH